MKNDEENYFFSKLGKKSKMLFGSIYLDYKKHNKSSISNHYRQQLDKLFLEEDRNLNLNIFDSPPIKTNKSMLETNNSIASFFYEERKKSTINNYKYHQIHLEKLKKLKESGLFNQKQRQVIYEPNYDYIKTKIISGPKWDKITGRKKEKKLILNKSFNVLLEKIKFRQQKKKKYLKKLKIIKLKKSRSSINFTPKLQKLKEKIKLCPKFEKEKNKKIKKITIKKTKKLISLFPELETSKIYMLQETDINNKNFQKIFNLETSINNVSKRKPLKTDIKIFKHHQIGLNYEQLKMINSFRCNKNNLKEKIKKLKLNNESGEKNKLIKTEDKKEDIDKKKASNNSESTLIKKSFNYFIDKSKLKKENNEENKYNNKSFYPSYPPNLKKHEFYKFNIDDLTEYSFPKFDNITLKAIKSK